MTEFSFYTDGNQGDPDQDQILAQQQAQQAVVTPQPLPQNQIPLYNQPQDDALRVQKYSFLIFLIIFFLIPAGVFGLLYYRTQPDQSDQSTEETNGEVQGAATENTGIVSAPVSVEGKIFYIQSNNVYMAEKNGNNEVSLTNFNNNQEGALEALELIDENTLGFYRCEPQIKNPGCEILQVDINTKEVSTLQKLESSLLLAEVSWADKDTYAYAVLDSQNQIVTIFVRMLLSDTEIVSFENLIQNRSAFIEDDFQLRISPDNTKLYYINTAGRTGFDFTVYVYDFGGAPIDQIDNATMPDWYDDNTIVYRGYSNNETGYLYLRDVNNRISTRLNKSHLSAYGPRSLNNRVVYWESSSLGMVYLYNVDADNIRLLGVNTAFPVWVSDHEVMYLETRKCKSNECVFGTLEFETQFVSDSYYLLDLNSEIETKVQLSDEVMDNGFVTWYHRKM